MSLVRYSVVCVLLFLFRFCYILRILKEKFVKSTNSTRMIKKVKGKSKKVITFLEQRKVNMKVDLPFTFLEIISLTSKW